jgi:hypothetical protein
MGTQSPMLPTPEPTLQPGQPRSKAHASDTGAKGLASDRRPLPIIRQLIPRNPRSRSLGKRFPLLDLQPQLPRGSGFQRIHFPRFPRFPPRRVDRLHLGRFRHFWGKDWAEESGAVCRQLECAESERRARSTACPTENYRFHGFGLYHPRSRDRCCAWG